MEHFIYGKTVSIFGPMWISVDSMVVNIGTFYLQGKCKYFW